MTPDSTVVADVAIEPWSQGGFGLAIGLDVRLPDLSLAEAMSLVVVATAEPRAKEL